MHVDPLLPVLALACLAVFAAGFLLRRLGQPFVIGYLLGGILLGPRALGVIEDGEVVGHVGAIGVVFLLFFVGMEVSPRRLLAGLGVSLGGTLVQVLLSVAAVWSVGLWFDWPVARIVLLGCVISLSSTAVVVKLLEDEGRGDSALGERVLGILLVQDVAIIPMLILIGFLGGEAPTAAVLVKQALGTVLVVGVMSVLARRDEIDLGLKRLVGRDDDLQVFVGLIICLGCAWLTALLDLSSALGAFVAGMIVASARETHWIHEALVPFRVVLLAAFFVSVGLLVDLDFAARHWRLILSMTALVFVLNTLINGVILRMLGLDRRDAAHGAALLAPIGELSFVLASVGASAGIIGVFAYQATLAMITTTMVLGPLWTLVLTRFVGRPEPVVKP
ncbi:MAG: cation:proton antiporter [Planctomycetota bacterium]